MTDLGDSCFFGCDNITSFSVADGNLVYAAQDRLSTIQHADNIIVLSHGKILEQGNHQELLAKHGRYYQLYTLQYHKEQLEG